MRLAVLIAMCGVLRAQAPHPVYEPLSRAYEALRAENYDAAIDGFRRAVELAPRRADIRKDLGYTYLKVGETEAAREQFHEAMRLEPSNTHVAMEYAFLCFETNQQAQARRIFDRVRKTGDPVAEKAFSDIDSALVAGIDRWKKAIAMGGGSFSAHFELATLAERRDELELAAEHYEKAWRLRPSRRPVLVDLGRVWLALNRVDDANSALLAASRGGEPRAAELARELLPDRYPYVAEFQRALALDPANGELRREFAYLLLRMERQAEAESEFRILAKTVPDDLLSATQLGFLLYAHGDTAGAMPLFDRVLAGKDDDLANRVRAVLRVPQVVQPRNEATVEPSIDARLMAERSLKAGYMKDALKYLQLAHEADPVDFNVMLKMGWTYNALRQDGVAVRWFDLARKSPDPLIAAEASRAFRNLRTSTSRFRTSAWLAPTYSSRWNDTFSYGQAKVDVRTALPVRPYVSVRFIGDTRQTIGATSPQYLSESAFILGVGAATVPWRGVTVWGEAGSSISYLKGHMLPDYRGGVSYSKGFGRTLGAEASGWFTEMNADGVFISRFGKDTILYSQNRAGFTAIRGEFRAQFYWNANATGDSKREYWANVAETGPGLRFRGPGMPASAYFTVNWLRGAYWLNAGNPRRPNFNDLRVGVWYAFTH
jgi:Flp pilus assembly protein TadD